MDTDQRIRWFLARSDVEAAMQLLLTDDAAKRSWLPYIEKFWPSYFGDYRKVYETAGHIEARVSGDDVVASVVHQWRFQVVASIINQLHPKAHILDYGCSRGAHAINFHKLGPGRQWSLIDIDETSLAEAKRLVSRHATVPRVFDYTVADGSASLGQGYYDAAIMLEVLEHVTSPERLVENLERAVKPGGLIIISVPSGPVEYEMWCDSPNRFREHVREFHLADLFELFGAKAGLTVTYSTTTLSHHLQGQFVGCFVCIFRAQSGSIGAINWDRKLASGGKLLTALPGENHDGG